MHPPSMSTLVLSFHDQSVELRFPTDLARIVTNLFASRLLGSGAGRICLTIEDHQGTYSIASSDGGLASKVSQSSLPVRLVEEVTKYLITDLRTAVALHAGAVGHDTKRRSCIV